MTPQRVLRAFYRKRRGGPSSYEQTPRRYRISTRIFYGHGGPEDEGQEDA